MILNIILALTSGYEIKGLIDNKNIPTLRFSEIELTLIGKKGFRKKAFVDLLGKFKIDLEEPGIYKLETFHHNFYFEPVVVDIKSDLEMESNPQGKQNSAFLYQLQTGSKGIRLIYPVQLEPSHKIKYFEIEEPFNPLVYLKSPYALMIGFSALMMFMMKQVPKEEMEAYQEQQSDSLKQCQPQ